jgi:predicted dehydrogenase
MSDRVKVAWCADPDAKKAEQLAAATGARPLTDYRTGLAEVEAVFAIVPHHLHCPITVDALRAGCHVMVEKPIARTLDEADQMIAAAEQSGKILMVGYLHRYRKSMRQFKQLVTGGAYGRLYLLDGCMEDMMQGSFQGWLAKSEFLGGGVFFSSSPHMLDVMMWIAGDVQNASMAGTNSGTIIDAEDTAVGLLKFKSGVVGVTRHTWASPQSRVWYTMHAVCEQAHVTLTTTPLGDLFHEGPDCRWRTKIEVQGQTDETVFDDDEGLDVVPEIEHFLDCVESGTTPETDGLTARRVIEVVLQAYEDAERKCAN